MKMNKPKTSTLKVGRVIYELLHPILPTYPVIADKGVTGDFCTYRRLSLEQIGNKDKIHDLIDYVVIEINVAATKYDNSVELASKIKDTLEDKANHKVYGHRHEDIDISDITLQNASESWVNDFYLQQMTFVVEVTKM